MVPVIDLTGRTVVVAGTTTAISQTSATRPPGLADTTDFRVMVGNVPGTIRASYETLRELRPDATAAALEQLQKFADASNLIDGFVLKLIRSPA